MNLQQKYNTAVKQLIEWANAYYVEDNPLASDEEYDALLREVLSLEEQGVIKNIDSPTGKVGGDINITNKVQHPHQMYSQQDVFSIDELYLWLTNIMKNRTDELVFLLEPKYDGLSLKVIYQEGKLISATTRGDGKYGEDVTRNAVNIKNLPLTIPSKDYTEINGEVVISKSKFLEINAKREQDGLSLYANPRNLAAGSLRLLSPDECKNRGLEFFFWELVNNPKVDMKSTNVTNKYYKPFTDLGFKKQPYSFTDLNNDPEYIISVLGMILEELEFQRASDDIPVDGCVIKILNPDIREQLGYTNKFPRWSCAYKFKPVEMTTKILDIKLQVGRLGTITPVAVVKPILIDGSTVSSATLSNFEDIKRKDIRVGDEVTLIKSGDIIPKIVSIFKDRRGKNSVPYVAPIKCPTCDTLLVKDNSYLKCPNIRCNDRVCETLKYFTDRDHMDIQGFGNSIIRHLVEVGLVKAPVDLYKLNLHDLEVRTTFGDKTKVNLLRAVTNSFGKPLWLLIGSLGIPEVGRTISKTIFDKIGINILTATEDELLDMQGVGEVIAKNLADYTRNNYHTIQELIMMGRVNIAEKKVIAREWRPDIKEVVLSGSSSFGKHLFIEALEELGISVKGSVGKSTDLLIYGEGAGIKLDKANTLGILTLTYDQVYNELVENKIIKD